MAKIQLVEDNELNRDMLSRRLTKRGHEVLLAADGAEAVAKTAAEQPDLVLMDMSLPVMDGWEATRVIKADPRTQAIPVIALTAHAMQGDRERALAAGSDEFETKPIERPRLLEKMEQLLASGDLQPIGTAGSLNFTNWSSRCASLFRISPWFAAPIGQRFRSRRSSNSQKYAERRFTPSA